MAISEKQVREIFLIEKELAMSGEHLVSARGTPNERGIGNYWKVVFQLDPLGGRQFGQRMSIRLGIQKAGAGLDR